MKKLILFLAFAATCFPQAQPVKRVVQCTDASVGGNDTYTATAVPALGSYVDGQWLEIAVLTANTGAATMDCGPGAKTLVKLQGGVSTTLADNDLVPKGKYLGYYNTTDDNIKVFSMVGAAAGGASTNTQQFMASPGGTVAATTTSYTWANGGSATPFSTEAGRQNITAAGGTINGARIWVNGTQPASGALVCSVRVNGAAGSPAIVVTIPLSSTTGAFTQDTPGNSLTFSAGDRLSWECANAASGTSITVVAAALQVTY